MIFDGRDSSLPLRMAYDIVIVGGGPAGITVAKELQPLGLKIALLESGGQDFDPDTQELYLADHKGNTETDLLAGRLRYLGGTSNHWGGHCLPLDPLDFERTPLNGMSGWPISFADLGPFYLRAHDYCDLGKFDYDYTSFPQISDDNLFLAQDPDIETVAFRQSPPTRFGDKYASWLEKQPNIDLWLHTNATDIQGASEDVIDSLTTQTLSGVQRVFTARSFVLACGSVEVARLLLYANDQNSRNYGNQGGLLGGCFLDHPTGGAAFVHFENPVSNKVYWQDENYLQDGVAMRFMMRLSDEVLVREGLNNCQFFLFPFKDSEKDEQRSRAARSSYNSLKSIGKWALNYDENPRFSLSNEFCTFINNADSFIAQTAIDVVGGDEGYKRVLLKFETEQSPDPANRITLAPERDALNMPTVSLNWTVSDDDLDSVRRTTRVFAQAFGKAGLGRLQMEDHSDRPYWGTTTSWHHLGTTRMAANPSDGVVDPNCRVWGTKNLYVASGGVMPTSGRANPTLSILALSIRLADHLKQEV